MSPPRKAPAKQDDLATRFSDYAPSIEGRDVVAIDPRYGLFVDGRERDTAGPDGPRRDRPDRPQQFQSAGADGPGIRRPRAS